MNWIRDNILKVVIILVVFILVIILFSVFSSLGGKSGDDVVKASGYEELENKLQSAAIGFAKNNRDVLPKDETESTKIKLETLQKNKYIGKIYAIENSKQECSGEVLIAKKYNKENDYSFYPKLSCGKYYTTLTLTDYILKNDPVVETGDGLYKDGEGYVFRGDYPNNNIIVNNKKYRILSIDKDGNLKLLSTNKTKSAYVWDNRYNTTTGKYSGLNDFDKSRMKDNLLFLYQNRSGEKGEVFFNDNDVSYIIPHDYCVGKVDPSNRSFDNNTECSDVRNLFVGTLTLRDYYIASISSDCNSLVNKSCNNYNYLFDNNVRESATLSASSKDNTSIIIMQNSSIKTALASDGYPIRPVIYISVNNLYLSGDGKINNPYTIR